MMDSFTYQEIALLIMLIMLSVFLMYGSIISVLENERRAAIRLLMLIIIPVFFWFPVVLLPQEVAAWYASIALTIFVLAATILFFPTRLLEKKVQAARPRGQINEKTVMFSRKLLEPGSERYEEYYKDHPQHEAKDLKFRSRPGLLSKKSSFYDPFTFTASHSIFDAITAFHPIVDGEPSEDKINIDPERLLTFVEGWLKKDGAVSVGVTETMDYHWYSVVGRGPDFGKKAQLPHSHAIAFTVEMDKEFMDPAPKGPTVMESARKYMNAAVMATNVAMFLRNLGYQARAHIDGNYRLVCPLVARDAGLGEIGRMGLLMTPELGPRVRIGVVTTDFSLPTSKAPDFSHMIDFCRICKKCADVCPSRAIPFDDQKEIDGVHRWQIDQEACYTLWCITGTDCGKCMSDCPYSHPENFFHNVIRRLIKNSRVFRYLALKMDDFIYGRKPKASKVPDWLSSHFTP